MWSKRVKLGSGRRSSDWGSVECDGRGRNMIAYYEADLKLMEELKE